MEREESAGEGRKEKEAERESVFKLPGGRANGGGMIAVVGGVKVYAGVGSRKEGCQGGEGVRCGRKWRKRRL